MYGRYRWGTKMGRNFFCILIFHSLGTLACFLFLSTPDLSFWWLHSRMASFQPSDLTFTKLPQKEPLWPSKIAVFFSRFLQHTVIFSLSHSLLSDVLFPACLLSVSLCWNVKFQRTGMLFVLSLLYSGHLKYYLVHGRQ